jgi:mannitol-1-phosphate/altronate dehydrogenase
MAEAAVGPELRAWIEQNTTFPNSMVDRITPATETQHKDILKQVGADEGTGGAWLGKECVLGGAVESRGFV